MDRVIRARVLDKNGRSIPGATVKVSIDGTYFGQAVAAQTNAGTVYTFQIDDSKANVTLRAEYGQESPQDVALADTANEWDFMFSNVEVPVTPTKPFWQEHLPGIIGAIFIPISIVLAIVFGNPTGFQRRIFLGTFAIALAGLGAEIPGFLNVKLTLGKQLAVTGAGALAIFALAYFFVPA